MGFLLADVDHLYTSSVAVLEEKLEIFRPHLDKALSCAGFEVGPALQRSWGWGLCEPLSAAQVLGHHSQPFATKRFYSLFHLEDAC